MDSIGDGEFEAQNDAALRRCIVRHDGFRARQDADRPLLGWIEDGRNRGAERPGQNITVGESESVQAPKCRGENTAWPSGPAGMSHSWTLMEYEHDCHVAASLGLAIVDDRCVARDSVIRKQ